MASLFASISQGCASGGGVFTLTQAEPGPGAGANLVYTWFVLDKASKDYGTQFDPGLLPVQVDTLPNGVYDTRVQAIDQDTGIAYRSALKSLTVACAASGSQFQLDRLDHTDETAAQDDGTATIQASGGVSPLTALLVDLGQSKPAVDGQPVVYTKLPPATYTLQITDSSTPTPQVVSGQVTIAPYVVAVDGCQDEYAENFDPAATSGGMASCAYAPRWRAAWQPMAVPVPALAGQTAGYTAAELRIGFRVGHPLNFLRPLGEPLRLRVTVGPDGYATFRLGPYLQAALGVPDSAGGYRLDLNAQGADDACVGYELRRLTGEMLEHGYAINAAVPEDQLFEGRVLSSFERVPVWPGYSWKRFMLTSRNLGRYGAIDEVYPTTTSLPCPANPLPVAWLNPLGGFDFWVFQGRTQFGDTVGEGQQFQEALTGQQRYSDPGNSYQTFKASSGVFAGDDLLAGLRTLWRSPQAWYQPDPESEWVPIMIPRETRDVGRMGVRRQEVPLNFTTATPEWAQGQ